ncbi:hypothetical protein BGZ99_002459, partial [Dissophora globulifera]
STPSSRNVLAACRQDPKLAQIFLDSLALPESLKITATALVASLSRVAENHGIVINWTIHAIATRDVDSDRGD